MRQAENNHLRENETRAQNILTPVSSVKLRSALDFPLSNCVISSGDTSKSELSKLSRKQKSMASVSVRDRGETKTKKKVLFSPDTVSSLSDPKTKAQYQNKDCVNSKQNGMFKTQGSSKSSTGSTPKNIVTLKAKIVMDSTLNPTPFKQNSEKKCFRSTPKPENSSTSAIRLRSQTKEAIQNELDSSQSDCLKSASLNAEKDVGNVELGSGSPICRLETTDNLNVGLTNISLVQSESLTMEEQKSKKTPNQVQNQALVQFDSQIKMPDDFTNIMTRQPGMQFDSSDVFQNVLLDMYGNSEKGNSGNPRCLTKLNPRGRNIAIYVTQFVGKVKAHQKFKRLKIRGEEKVGRFDKVDMPSNKNAETTKSGWGVVHRSLREKNAQTNASQEEDIQDGLTHALRGFTGLEHIRRDLYERYGVIPMRRSDGTVVHENIMLSDQARSLMASQSRI